MPHIENEYYTKLIAGGFKYPVTITRKGKSFWFNFGYNKALIDEIKNMEGARYHGFDKENPIKQWSVTDSPRNHFQIERMEGKNPYSRYDKPLIDFIPKRKEIRDYQIDMIKHGITRHYAILAAEMALGKTVCSIEIMEWLYFNQGVKSWFFIAPNSALISVKMEFEVWKSVVQPQFFTYEKLKSIMENWPEGSPPPMGVILDEFSRAKTPNAQRSQAVMHLANGIRQHYGEDGVVIGMSGSCAPNDPGDWWNLAEICQPGFFREGTLEKFKKRLSVQETGESASGQVYSKIVTWKDNEKKCDICGKFKEDKNHDDVNMCEKWFHNFRPCVNEVAKVYDRMKGLVIVKLKKDCLKELPELIYKRIYCKPTQSILNAAKLIAATGGNAMQVAILLRELSDGFQYQKEDVGKETCPLCSGEKIREDYQYIGPDDKYTEISERQAQGQFDAEEFKQYFEKMKLPCSYCNGTGETIKYVREARQVPCPKEDALKNLIDQHEDVGRLVIYAGFTGSVDRCVKIVQEQKWDYIRIDGRGWNSNLPGDSRELYKKFKFARKEHERIAIVAQPSAGGMGLNLQESPSEIFYSNDYKGESRIQAKHRIHRPGMDINRGATIYDLIHLKSDELVLESLEKKEDLQSLTLGDFKSILENQDGSLN